MADIWIHIDLSDIEYFGIQIDQEKYILQEQYAAFSVRFLFYRHISKNRHSRSGVNDIVLDIP
jgi:hypothetical protein